MLKYFQGFLLRPGHENLVALGAVSTKSDQQITMIPPEKRGCYFPHEQKLKLHK